MDMDKPKDTGETHVVAFEDAAPYIREIIGGVLKLERDQLYSKRPRVIDDVAIVVREAVARRNRTRETGGREE